MWKVVYFGVREGDCLSLCWNPKGNCLSGTWSTLKILSPFFLKQYKIGYMKRNIFNIGKNYRLFFLWLIHYKNLVINSQSTAYHTSVFKHNFLQVVS